MIMKIVKYNRSIYSNRAIDEAILAYSQLATITKSINNEYVELTFDNCKYDDDITVKEFENYLIGIENS